MQSLTIDSHYPEETEALGAAIADILPDGAVVALRGDLGTGKTCFVRGMAASVGCANAVSSPTFTLINEYPGSKKLTHIDLYRIESVEELFDLGYEELFDQNEGLCVVEWAERAETLLPPARLDITLKHVAPTQRQICITNVGLLPEGWEKNDTLVLRQ